MKFTIEQLEKLDPCEDGLEWYKENIKTDNIEDILIQLNNYNPSWSRWLMVRVIDLSSRKKLAIFSAELVLDICEKKYPKDMRVRECIQAAKDYSLGKINATELVDKRYAAHAAAYDAAAHAAATAAAAAAYYAAHAAAAANAAYAVNAAYYAAHAAHAAAAKKEIQEKIIKEAIRLKEVREV